MSGRVEPTCGGKKDDAASHGITREDLELPNAADVERGAFAFVLHNVFSEAECRNMIEASERRGYSEALISTGATSQTLDKSYRHSDRNIHDDPGLAQDLFARVRGELPQSGTFGYGTFRDTAHSWSCKGLNERLRFLRYDSGMFFAPHKDGSYHRPDGTQQSMLTVMLYLNTCGKDYEGGMTRFVTGDVHGDSLRGIVAPEAESAGVVVTPRAGDVLIFTHPVLHEGVRVLSGRKYAVRTDVMYCNAMEDVRGWLHENELGVYGDAFEHQGYDDMSLILDLSHKEIEELATDTAMSHEHRLRLQMALGGHRVAPPPSSAADCPLGSTVHDSASQQHERDDNTRQGTQPTSTTEVGPASASGSLSKRPTIDQRGSLPSAHHLHDACVDAPASRVRDRARGIVRRLSNSCEATASLTHSWRWNHQQQQQQQVSSIYSRTEDEPENHELSAYRRSQSNGT